MSKLSLPAPAVRFGIDRPLYPLYDTSQKLGNCSRSTIYRLIDKGKLKRVKRGATSLITGESIADYLAELCS
jgi:excisionase family DNA binding protein